MGRETELRARWTEAGQGHVFRFWDDLDAAGRAGLEAQLAELDPSELRLPDAGRPAGLEPPEALTLDSPERPALGEAGAAELAAGRVAALTVAGGQGTRLGLDGPKGLLAIGPVSDRTLFGLFAQQIARLGTRHGAAVPWLVMTSPATDAATRAFFEREGWLGLDPAQVRFVVQGTLPVLDAEGRVLLAAPGRLAVAPDGHGGVFAALRRAGMLTELADRGVERVFYHHVDNPLAAIADPAFVGLHVARGAAMSCKAVEKLDPLEKVGFLAVSKGRLRVVEYSEIDPEVAAARDAEGRLRFRLGSIGIHVFERAFLEEVAEGPPLPLHAAAKPVEALGPDGAPARVAGIKLERFVFDALARARRVAVMETGRQDEYSPVKNARGGASPATARRDLAARYRRWMVEAGLEAPGEDAVIEIDQSLFAGPDDLREGSGLADGAPAFRIAKGTER